MPKLSDQFGAIDIYLFDQLLRDRIVPGHRVLDVGCGPGRNLEYMLRSGFVVHAGAVDEECVSRVRALVAQLAPKLEGERVHLARLEALPFADDAFDAVIVIAVLHFARDLRHFEEMLAELVRVIAPGGMFLARVASDIGLESAVHPLGDGRYTLPDGTDRFLVNEKMRLDWTERAGATLLDPIKTTNVQGTRCMTTWTVRLPA